MGCNSSKRRETFDKETFRIIVFGDISSSPFPPNMQVGSKSFYVSRIEDDHDGCEASLYHFRDITTHPILLLVMDKAKVAWTDDLNDRTTEIKNYIVQYQLFNCCTCKIPYFLVGFTGDKEKDQLLVNGFTRDYMENKDLVNECFRWYGGDQIYIAEEEGMSMATSIDAKRYIEYPLWRPAAERNTHLFGMLSVFAQSKCLCRGLTQLG